MTLSTLIDKVLDFSNFQNLQDYYDFYLQYSDFIETSGNLQATIRCQNDHAYQFFQYMQDGNFSITRPINIGLWLDQTLYGSHLAGFQEVFSALARGDTPDESVRPLLGKFIYTTQQAIGATLDALPVGESNKARKINGMHFERFIRMLIASTGLDCKSGTIQVPIHDDSGKEIFKTKYEHDLLIRENDQIKIIGSVKTSSKDRIDKVFVDKFLYSRLTGTETPHIAIFLNDVQRTDKTNRKTTPPTPQYGVSSTFLPGKFKAYTIKLNSLDGVYYCDLRPNMTTDPLLASQIRSIDHLFYEDMQRLLATAEVVEGTEIV